MPEDPPINNGAQEQMPARQDVDVLLDVSELEVDRIKLTVKDLRAHVSVLAELASLLYLQVGVDARLDEVRARDRRGKGQAAPEGPPRRRARHPQGGP